MLRIALSKGSEYIPVERELQHVANYLEIESTIYQGRFTYEVEADPAVMSCTVLKILLQPLAENSITHALPIWSAVGISACRSGRMQTTWC